MEYILIHNRLNNKNIKQVINTKIYNIIKLNNEQDI